MATERKWKVWLMVVHPDREDIIRSLEAAGCEVVIGRSFTDARYLSEDEIVAKVPEMDALMVSTGELMTRRVMEAAKRVRVISKVGIGVEQIDVKAATYLGIMVTNTPTEFNVFSTAEYAVSMILAMAKKFKLADYNARRGKWRSVYSTLLYGKTVGIVGLGRIGSRVARLLAPFGVKLLAFSPHAAAEKAQSLGVRLVDLDTLLKESDFVTLHAVQNAQTRGMIGEARLRLMKPTAYLINTARGGLVKESALAKALKEGRIAGAALDVFEPEVPRPDNPLLDEDFYFKTLYTPHAAGLNPDNEWQLPVVQMENCVTALRGEIPKYVVNPDVIPKWRERIRALDNGR